MQDRNNTIAGWVLFAGIVALGGSIVTGEMFHSEKPEEGGYKIEGVVVEGEGAAVEKPIDFSVADATKGEQVFKKCTACHNADKGGANALGPNLWNVIGEPIGKGAGGFAFSEALAGKGGAWDFASLSDWLSNPKKFAPGTKMTFAGLANPEDRANVIAFLNQHGDAPKPLPAAPAAAAPAAGDKAAAEAAGAGAEKAANEPVLNEAQAAKGGQKNVGGDAAKISQ
ncbi:MAG: cytochrome c family protein [Sphingomonas sp.]|uniref:c-type cytochrome n=1 Tax=Sphingomonas sp. TaxID=28214 RepID=UPI00184A635C|nr:cytochrome c family protein [Sphingomonas sp.]MBA3667697.1 cytochrome c family protein [Sphingomonas sp.]